MNHRTFTAGAALVLCSQLAFAAPVSIDNKLLEMSEQLDQLDQMDFSAAIERANRCTRTRDFDCAERQIAKAAKLAHSARDKDGLKLAQRDLLAERRAVEEERRQREEEERRLAEAEERMRAAQAEAERMRTAAAEEDEGPSTASQLLQFGTTVLRTYQANHAAAAAANAARAQAFKKMQADAAANVAAEQQRFAEERARINGIRRSREQQALQAQSSSQAQRNAPSAAQPAPRAAANTNLSQAPSVAATTYGASPNGGAYAGNAVASTPAADESWKSCGPGKTCKIGDGYIHACSGPPIPGGKMCPSECRMTSGVFYHDTTLPSDRVYIPSDKACPENCNIWNSC